MAATYRRRQGALMITLSLAMRAKLGQADPEDLDRAQAMITEAFGTDAPIAHDLSAFGGEMRQCKHLPKELAIAGEDLFQAVVRATWPSPPQRADFGG